MEEFFKKGNKRTGLIFILITLLMFFSSTILTFLFNPFYLVQYISTILLFGQAFNLLFLLIILGSSLYYFMNFRLQFLTKKRMIGFLLLSIGMLIFISSIQLTSTTFQVGDYKSFESAYDLMFMTQIENIRNMGNVGGRMIFTFTELGIILPLFYWIFSIVGYFMPMITILILLLIAYSINIIIVDDYHLFFAKFNLFSKEKINISKQAEQVDLNQPTEEFETNFSPEEKEKMKIVEKVRGNMDRESYKNLSKQIEDERDRFKELREKVIQKVQKLNEEQRSKSKISEKQREEIMGTFGYTSFSKLKMQSEMRNEQSKIVKEQLNHNSTEDKQVETKINNTTNNDEKTLVDDYMETIVTEMINTSDPTQEIPMINEYYDDIFKKEDELVDEIEKTLETTIQLDDEKTGEIIIEDIKEEVTVEQYFNLSDSKEIQDSNNFNSNAMNTSEIIVNDKIENSVEIESIKKTNQWEESEIDDEEKIEQRSNDWCQPYILPSTTILSSEKSDINNQVLVDEATNKAKKLNDVFTSFGVKAIVNSFEIGPTVTTFKVELEAGIKTTKVTNLEDNIKLSLGAEYIRILAPIPGTSFIGVEVPNSTKKPVTFKSVYDETNDDSAGIQISIGQDVSGKPLSFDLSQAPHLLVAGSTGSGKSVAINTILASILLRYKPTDVQLILVDPKMVEFAPFHGIPHLMSEVITDASNANKVLQAMVQEMEDRYRLMAKRGAKKIEELNNILIAEGSSKLPYIVIVIDELADLMMVAAKDVEESIMRITQKARAAGIHMILATQRPSTEIITGTIKSNIPSRMAFTVASSIDSRTILGTVGAEKLIGMGDMLVSLYGKLPFRGQGAYISNSEVDELVAYTKSQCKPHYIIDVDKIAQTVNFGGALIDTNDPVYIAARDTVIHYQKASTSMLQRHLNIGYNKAATIIDTLEQEGIIGPANGSKPREVF